MSLESALAEEARDVVAILEGRNLKPTQRVRAGSPAGMAQSPVRSMLDIGDTSAPKARHTSVAGAAVGITKLGTSFSQHEPVRSMLDATTSTSICQPFGSFCESRFQLPSPTHRSTDHSLQIRSRIGIPVRPAPEQR